MELLDDKEMRSVLIDGKGEVVGYIEIRGFLKGKRIVPVKKIWVRHKVFRESLLQWPWG